MDSGSGQMEASLVKLFSCRAAEWVCLMHADTWRYGLCRRNQRQPLFVDARVLSIFEGAEETLALKVIARDLIAKPPRMPSAMLGPWATQLALRPDKSPLSRHFSISERIQLDRRHRCYFAAGYLPALHCCNNPACIFLEIRCQPRLQ